MAKSYKKRDDGRMSTTVGTGKVNPETGKEIRVTVYGYTKEELESKKAELLMHRQHGTYANDEGMTLSKCAQLWYNTTIEPSQLSNHTKNDYEYAIRSLAPIGGMRLKELRKMDFQNLLSQAQDHPEKQRRILLTSKQILNFAVDNEFIYKNVCQNIKLHSPVRSEKRALTEAEKKAIRKCTFTDMEKLYVYTLYFTGLRKSEALALTKKSINMADHTISVTSALEFIDSNQPNLKAPKSEHSIRTVHIPDALYALYKDYLKELNGLYIFHRADGQLMSFSIYRKFWYRIRSKINVAAGGNSNLDAVQGLTPHTFRHNYASMLYDSGIGVKEAQKLMGHSNIKITLEIYTHLESKKQESAEKLNRLAL